MFIKVKKVILIQDNITSYDFLEYYREKADELRLILGDTRTFIDLNKFDTIVPPLHVEESLFPKGRVIPLTFTDLTDGTAIVLRLRPDHLLMNTSLSQKKLLKYFLYSEPKGIANYIFYGFEDKNLKIEANISKDSIGLLQQFSLDMTNNLLREAILNLISEQNFPTSTIKRFLFEQAENSIEFKNSFFVIKFKGKYQLILDNDLSVKDMIYLIYYKTEESDLEKVNSIFQKIRGENRLKKMSNNYKISNDHIEAFVRNRTNFLNSVKSQEKLLDVDYHESFSTFFENSVKVSKSSAPYLSYRPIENISFSFWPDNFESYLISK